MLVVFGDIIGMMFGMIKIRIASNLNSLVGLPFSSFVSFWPFFKARTWKIGRMSS